MVQRMVSLMVVGREGIGKKDCEVKGLSTIRSFEWTEVFLVFDLHVQSEGW